MSEQAFESVIFIHLQIFIHLFHCLYHVIYAWERNEGKCSHINTNCNKHWTHAWLSSPTILFHSEVNTVLSYCLLVLYFNGYIVRLWAGLLSETKYTQHGESMKTKRSRYKVLNELCLKSTSILMKTKP